MLRTREERSRIPRERPDGTRYYRPMDAFSDPQAVERYAAGPPRLVPGFADLHRMATILLSTHVPEDARLLVLGAGGGLELKAFAQAHPGWTFDGVDPSAEMLRLAERMLGDLASRARLHEGYIHDAPEGPFDGACSLLTLHFIEKEERLRTLQQVRRRLKPGAPFVAAHFSVSREERTYWFDRYVDFAVSSGIAEEQARRGRAAIEANVPILSPEEDEELLYAAGFSDVRLFYAAFTFRGWVARA